MEIVKYYKQKHFYDNKEKVATTSSNSFDQLNLLYSTLGIDIMKPIEEIVTREELLRNDINTSHLLYENLNNIDVIKDLRQQMMEHRSYFTDMYDDWS